MLIIESTFCHIAPFVREPVYMHHRGSSYACNTIARDIYKLQSASCTRQLKQASIVAYIPVLTIHFRLPTNHPAIPLNHNQPKSQVGHMLFTFLPLIPASIQSAMLPKYAPFPVRPGP